MISFRIEILTITGPLTQNKGTRSWQVLEIAYKKEGKIEGKKLFDFNGKEIFEVASKAKQGEIYNITSEKENDFWIWKTMVVNANENTESPATGSKNDVAPSKTLEQGLTNANSKPFGRVTGSNYETPEERKLRREFEKTKHRQIGRQGCINSAIAYLSSQSKVKYEVSDIIRVASELENNYVFLPIEEVKMKSDKSSDDAAGDISLEDYNNV
jgi:hypothetical protein